MAQGFLKSVVIGGSILAFMELGGINTGLPIYETGLLISKLKHGSKTEKITRYQAGSARSVHNEAASMLHDSSWPNKILWINVEDTGYLKVTEDIWYKFLHAALSDLENVTDFRLANDKIAGLNTIEAEQGYLCGKWKLVEIVPNECIPSMLSQKGYATYYYHSNDLSFYRRRPLMTKMGFKSLFSSKESISNGSLEALFTCFRRNFCAPDDSFLYDRVIKDASSFSKHKSVFQFIMTIDTHGPHAGERIYVDNIPHPSDYVSRLKKASADIRSLLDRYSSLLQEDERLFVILTSDHPPRHVNLIPPSKRSISSSGFTKFVTLSLTPR